MPSIEVALTAAEAAALRELAQRAPAGAASSPGRVLAHLYRRHLAACERARAAQAQALLASHWPVARKVAARAFQRCRGRYPLDELIAAATDEMMKGCPGYDPGRISPHTGGPISPAAYLRPWAQWGVRAYLRARQAEERQEVRPDQDVDGRGRWERLGEVDEGLEHAPLRAALADALGALRRGLPPEGRRILRALVLGEDDDQAAARVRCTLDQVDQVRAALLQHLAACGLAPQPDDELTPVQVARACALSPKVIYKALAAGSLPGRKRGGTWVVRAADARAFARHRDRGTRSVSTPTRQELPGQGPCQAVNLPVSTPTRQELPGQGPCQAVNLPVSTPTRQELPGQGPCQLDWLDQKN